ncbi:hypothetical protein GO755_04915 [Spirosoma sp. HMF4905]|uniref:Uncharacterized protein n=1 Tax=Spirosoma arboris TaxID=2682092 RepID=A0A7K1S6J3_9BACT|nr:hypothetical protein [Spirosoma arboris]MVM29365.1 hypothetical protein [Spirosoma arboris]
MAINHSDYAPQTVYQSVDVLLSPEIGGYTHDPIRVAYNLEQTGEDPNQLIDNSRLSLLPSVVYHRGAYVVVLQFEGALHNPRMAFIHFDVDIRQHFSVFADVFTPKALHAIYLTQLRIKQKEGVYYHQVMLTTELPGA